MAECVEAIRGYIDTPASYDGDQLAQVVTTLAELTYQNRQFLIAARLRDFVRQLREGARKSDVA